jgi:hypothetical protein
VRRVGRLVAPFLRRRREERSRKSRAEEGSRRRARTKMTAERSLERTGRERKWRNSRIMVV